MRVHVLLSIVRGTLRVLLGLLVVSACTPAKPEVPRSPLGFSGWVADDSGRPVSGALLAVNGRETRSARDGAFQIAVTEQPQDILTITHPEHADLVHITRSPLPRQIWKLTRAHVTTIDPRGPISIADERPSLGTKGLEGATFTLPANARVDPQGNAPSGSLRAAIATLDLARGERPGDWAVRGDDGREGSLVSYGAAFIQFSDTNGVTYQIRSGMAGELVLARSGSCCPFGANANNDNDCRPACGNSVIESGELCDGNCPTSCRDDGDGNACTVNVVTGGSCQRRCEAQRLSASTARMDGCCPAGAAPSTDSDCMPPPPTCGNRLPDPGETCDPCPTSCPEPRECMRFALQGSGSSVTCMPSPITSPAPGDNCCPDGENSSTDSDCINPPPAMCGNGRVEGARLTAVPHALPGTPATLRTSGVTLDAGRLHVTAAHVAYQPPCNQRL